MFSSSGFSEALSFAKPLALCSTSLFLCRIIYRSSRVDLPVFPNHSILISASSYVMYVASHLAFKIMILCFLSDFFVVPIYEWLTSAALRDNFSFTSKHHSMNHSRNTTSGCCSHQTSGTQIVLHDAWLSPDNPRHVKDLQRGKIPTLPGCEPGHPVCCVYFLCSCIGAHIFCSPKVIIVFFLFEQSWCTVPVFSFTIHFNITMLPISSF